MVYKIKIYDWKSIKKDLLRLLKQFLLIIQLKR